MPTWRVGAARNLPIVEGTWDGAAAKRRVFEWAGGDDFSPTKARKAFLAYDADDANQRGAYKLPFADVRDGELVAITGGLRAAASRLPQTDIPESTKEEARKVLDKYFDRMEDKESRLQFDDDEVPAPSTAEILILDVIGRRWWDDDGTDATSVVNFLAEQPKDAEIHVRINSPGGDAFEGAAIYNALAKDPRRVVVHIEALAASAASLVAMAGDEIRMAQNSMLMIHGASGVTFGTAGDHRDTADVLAKIDQAMAKTYAARSGVEQDKVEEWMEAETWMNADEAADRGFADVVTEAKRVEASWGRFGQQIVASFRKGSHFLSPAPQLRPHIAAQAVEGPAMELTKICAALGLPGDAQLDTIVAAIEARNEELERLKVAAAATVPTEPDPRKYASRDDLDKIRAHAQSLETRLRDRDLDELLVAAEGKLVFSDADRDRYRKFVREGGMTLDALREQIENTPVSPLATADEVAARTPATDEHGLDQEDLEFCAQYKLDPKIFAKNKANLQGLKVV